MAIDLSILKKEYEEAVRSTELGFWTPKTGENLIRILAPSSKEKTGMFYRQVHVHYGVEGAGMVFCYNNWNEDCPVCSFIKKLREAASIEAVNIAKRISRNERYLMNIVSLDDLKTTGVLAIRQWLAPKTLRLHLLQIMLDADWGDITDLSTGRDIVLVRAEKAGTKFTEYSIRPKPDRKAISIRPEQIPSFDEILTKNKIDKDVLRLKMFGTDTERAGLDDVDAYFKKIGERTTNNSNYNANANVNVNAYENRSKPQLELSDDELLNKAVGELLDT